MPLLKRKSEQFQYSTISSESAQSDYDIVQLCADLSMEQISGAEDSTDVIEALTEGDIAGADPGSAPDLEPSPLPPEPTPTAEVESAEDRLARQPRPGMADASDEQITRLLAFGDEPALVIPAEPEALTGDEVAAVEALEPAPEAAPAADPERLRALLELVRNGRAATEAKLRRQAEESDARYRAAKLHHQRELTAERVRKHRAAKRARSEKTDAEHLNDLETVPAQDQRMPGWAKHQYNRRLSALYAATANPNGDQFLIQIRGRESELATGWAVQQIARKRFGANASDAKVASLHLDRSMTKRRAQRLRENIAKLEEPGRPWHEAEGGALV